MIVVFLAAVGAVVLLTPVVRHAARRLDLIAAPTEDRWHAAPTALFGGVGIAIGVTVGVIVAAMLWGVPSAGEAWWLRVAGVFGASVIMFLCGVLDDIVGLRPPTKLVAQALAASVLVSFGVVYPLAPWFPLNVVATVFFFIAITNAFNLLDNMDGVTAGVSAITALGVALILHSIGQTELAALALAYAGAAIGFLPYNGRPASIFMGDSGSLFLGAAMAGLTVALADTAVDAGHLAAVGAPLFLLVVPILDTTLVMATRTHARYSVFQGGRDHVAHRLVRMGLSESRAALTLWSVTAMGALVAYLMTLSLEGPALWVGAVFGTGVLLFGIYLGHLHTYAPVAAERPSVVSYLFTQVVRWRRGFEVLLDVGLFAVAYTGAYLLRYDAAVPVEQMVLLEGTLALTVAAKSVAFALSGVYKGAWRRIGFADLNRLVRANVLGTLLTFGLVAFFYRNAEFSRSVFLIDALLAALLTTAARMSFRSLDHVRWGLNGHGARTLVYGAGGSGELVVREMMSNPEMELVPIGFLDDDPMKQGVLIHGLPVVGGYADLESALRDRRVDTVVLASRKLDPEIRDATIRHCRAAGLEVLQFELELTTPKTPAPAQAANLALM